MMAVFGDALRLSSLKAWRIGAVLLLCCMAGLPACAPKRQVYTPHRQPVYTPPPAPARTEVPQPVLAPPPRVKEREMAPPAVEPHVKTEKANPQFLASMERVKQAERHLAAADPDGAIPLLEQGIQIDAYNGECYFHLARAWRMKNAPGRALEFARKAEMLLLDKPAKLRPVYVLEAELLDGLGKPTEADEYRTKAERLR